MRTSSLQPLSGFVCRVMAQRVERRFRERLSGGGRRRRRRPTLGGGGGGGGAWSDGADMQAADWAVLPDSAGVPVKQLPARDARCCCQLHAVSFILELLIGQE